VRIYLLRHGETDWNVVRRLQGSVDTPLNKTGILQAESWRSYFSGAVLGGVYSSGLERAVHTAQLAAGRPACIITGFNERGFGQWEGRTWPELESTVSEFDARWNDNGFCPPGGESRLQLVERVRTSINDIITEHQSDAAVLIVAHGASGHAILTTLLEMPIDARGSLPSLTNASLTIVDTRSRQLQFYGCDERSRAAVSRPLNFSSK
jgi:probable phosphoglycerate mutase